MAGMAPRNRRPRAGSWRCRPSAWPSGWHPTLSKVDLLIIQIDGLPIGNDLVLVTALGIDGNGDRHPLGLVERATENTAVVQALIDNLIERGLDRRSVGCSSSTTFGGHTAIQRCQLHQARNVIERLPKASACGRSAGAAQSLGTRRRQKGRAAAAQPRPQARPGGARRCRRILEGLDER
jgi:putative transposase